MYRFVGQMTNLMSVVGLIAKVGRYLLCNFISVPDMKQPILIAAIIVASLVLGAILFLWQPVNHQQLLLSKEPTGGDFILNSIDGQVSLADFRGKIAILYFGYTMCPDICPTSLALLANGLNLLTKQQQAQIQPIFISVDPQRDGLEHLMGYGRYFHPGIIGVTGAPENIRTIADLYGASYRRVESSSSTGYMVDHSAYLYLIDRNGKLVESIAHGTPPEQIRNRLIPLLEKE